MGFNRILRGFNRMQVYSFLFQSRILHIEYSIHYLHEQLKFIIAALLYGSHAQDIMNAYFV